MELSLLSMLKTGEGPSKLLQMLATFGILPTGMQMIVRGLSKAPPPTRTTLDGDWFANIDVISHSIGCVLAGVFDDMTRDLDQDELKELTVDDIHDVIPGGYVGKLILASFENCKTLTLEHGSVSAAIMSGKVHPEGLVTHSIIQPFLQAKATTLKPKSRFGKNRASPYPTSLNSTEV